MSAQSNLAEMIGELRAIESRGDFSFFNARFYLKQGIRDCFALRCIPEEWVLVIDTPIGAE